MRIRCASDEHQTNKRTERNHTGDALTQSKAMPAQPSTKTHQIFCAGNPFGLHTKPAPPHHEQPLHALLHATSCFTSHLPADATCYMQLQEPHVRLHSRYMLHETSNTTRLPSFRTPAWKAIVRRTSCNTCTIPLRQARVNTRLIVDNMFIAIRGKL